jgi:chemotaxis protein MotB
MSVLAKRRSNRDTNIWPGFVDALATLLMVIIFVLMIFIVAQFYLTQALSGRDEALSQLQQQVVELADLLALERENSAELQASVTQLSADLQASLATRDAMETRLNAVSQQRDTLESRLADAVAERASLQQRIVTLQNGDGAVKDRLLSVIKERDALLGKLQAVETELENENQKSDRIAAELQDANNAIDVDRETIKLQLADLERLRRDIAALKTVRDDLEGKVAKLVLANQVLSDENTELDEANQSLADATVDLQRDLSQVRIRNTALEARLNDQVEKTMLAQKTIKQRDITLAELTSQYDLSQQTLTKEQQLSAEAQRQVALLNDQIAALRSQLAAINLALESSEAKNAAQNVKIVDLGKRLNAALATKVQELAKFRSEFFGRLRQILVNERNIRIVGDRFVFQSEVFFDPGSVDIGPAGQAQLVTFAQTLKELIVKIPPDINWVLQIEGHTDAIPISNNRFRNNWDLSAARAISVVQFLISQGLPAEHLVAAGYGEFQPIDPRTDEFARRRNRRIEMKLTQR